MDITSAVESAIGGGIFDIASWNRPRSSEELQDFIDLRQSRLVGNDEVE